MKNFEELLQKELDKLPYTKHLDDGQYNDGQITGFELGARWALSLFDVSGQSELFYCVSSDSLVHGKFCEKWCGNPHCKDLVKQ